MVREAVEYARADVTCDVIATHLGRLASLIWELRSGPVPVSGLYVTCAASRAHRRLGPLAGPPVHANASTQQVGARQVAQASKHDCNYVLTGPTARPHDCMVTCTACGPAAAAAMLGMQTEREDQQYAASTATHLFQQQLSQESRCSAHASQQPRRGTHHSREGGAREVGRQVVCQLLVGCRRVRVEGDPHTCSKYHQGSTSCGRMCRPAEHERHNCPARKRLTCGVHSHDPHCHRRRQNLQ